MEVFRISSEKHSSLLSASGKYNRWNFDKEYVIYTASSRALSTLELVVHMSAVMPTVVYKVMVISIPDEDDVITTVPTKDLPPNWRELFADPILQAIGSDWYQNDKSLVLKVPSAIITMEYNYLINTKHPDFKSKVKFQTEDYFWDTRLLT